MRKFGNSEFSTKPLNFYNLDMVISVGYRVRSQRGVESDIIESNKRARDSKYCRLATFHRVKGLEFDYMILAGMDDQTWEKDMQDEDALLRARCLVHVAATRARIELLVTASPSLAIFLRLN